MLKCVGLHLDILNLHAPCAEYLHLEQISDAKGSAGLTSPPLCTYFPVGGKPKVK